MRSLFYLISLLSVLFITDLGFAQSINESSESELTTVVRARFGVFSDDHQQQSLDLLQSSENGVFGFSFGIHKFMQENYSSRAFLLLPSFYEDDNFKVLGGYKAGVEVHPEPVYFSERYLFFSPRVELVFVDALGWPSFVVTLDIGKWYESLREPPERIEKNFNERGYDPTSHITFGISL